MSSIRIFKDQLDRKVEISFPPKRIISIVPSQTELLSYFGLDKEVVGITKFCVHPDEWFRTKERVGGTKQLNLEKIRQLNPDLIIGNKEENNQQQIEELTKLFPVWMSDVRNLDDAIDMIKRIGEITDKKELAVELSNNILNEFSLLQPIHPRLKAAYFIWQKPFMVVGRDTFVNDMLQRCGFRNVFEHYESRYPEITSEELTTANPDVILLSSEPFPFKEKHIHEFQAASPKARILLADGEMFSWYGSRLLKAVNYLGALQRKAVD